jgi:S1-C subfamily serine protease
MKPTVPLLALLSLALVAGAAGATGVSVAGPVARVSARFAQPAQSPRLAHPPQASPDPGAPVVWAAPALQSRPAPAEVGTVREVAQRARAAVAQITTERATLDRLGRPAATGRGVGSGVVYDAGGLVLTNNHVVEGATSLTVSLPDGRVYEGKVLGGDPQMDLAVLKIRPAAGEALPVAPLGNSATLEVGDWVVAIGNALGLPGGPTVTAGVVSAVGRAIQEPSGVPGEPGPYLYDLIQTDAAINPGNSGGPLFNLAGEVVGINTLGAGSDGDVMAQGIGFAIAIDTARPVADQLVTTGRVAHAYLGVAYAPVTLAVAQQLGLQVKQGLVLTQVATGSPAATAGLRPRDVVRAVDGQPVTDETTLGRVLSRRRPGDRLGVTLVRGAQQVTLDITLGERPA